MLRRPLTIALLAIGLSALAAAATSAGARAASPFAQLAGNWNGTGTVQFEGGQSESLTCRGYFSAKDGGSELGLVLRCASASSKIDLRSALRYEGGQVIGKWEERSFNVSGDVSGRASSSGMRLAIGGSGLSAAMSVSLSGSRQSVSINTFGTTLNRVFISLSRM